MYFVVSNKEQQGTLGCIKFFIYLLIAKKTEMSIVEKWSNGQITSTYRVDVSQPGGTTTKQDEK